MNPERYQRVQELFLAALDHRAEDQGAFVRAAEDDEAIANEVVEMLKHHDDEGVLSEESIGLNRRIVTDAFNNSVDTSSTPVARVFGDLSLDPTLLPEQIGGYRIDDILGEGGSGVVFRSTAPSGQQIALKVLRATDLDSQAQKRFRREIRILEHLDHPGIVKVIDSGVDETNVGMGVTHLPWLAMELVQGKGLSEWATRCQPSLEESSLLMARVLDALAHAHEQKIYHRDLKPQNLLIGEDGSLKVLDFGAAAIRQLDEGENDSVLTATGQIIGTMAYMSPEQVGGNSGAVDEQADVYAVGAMLYELASGQTPYDLRHLSFIACLRKLRLEEPPPLKDLVPDAPRVFVDLVEQALAKEPQDRPAGAAVFAEALRRLA
ncbi:MAG: serine/threonine-protein kinase [Planctomycetota bacterium]